MKAITQHESVVTYIKSCLIFQIARFMLMSKNRVISPLNTIFKYCHASVNLDVLYLEYMGMHIDQF